MEPLYTTWTQIPLKLSVISPKVWKTLFPASRRLPAETDEPSAPILSLGAKVSSFLTAFYKHISVFHCVSLWLFVPFRSVKPNLWWNIFQRIISSEGRKISDGPSRNRFNLISRATGLTFLQNVFTFIRPMIVFIILIVHICTDTQKLSSALNSSKRSMKLRLTSFIQDEPSVLWLLPGALIILVLFLLFIIIILIIQVLPFLLCYFVAAHRAARLLLMTMHSSKCLQKKGLKCSKAKWKLDHDSWKNKRRMLQKLKNSNAKRFQFLQAVWKRNLFSKIVNR